MKQLLILAAFLAGSMSQAQTPEAEKSPWKHESEISIVQVGGNSKAESYSAKQKTSVKLDLNTLTLSARYLQTKTAQVETAKSWDGSARYERELSNLWAAFVQHGAESDSYSGYIQRDNSDIGGKYFFIRETAQNFFSELGYRYSNTNSATAPGGHTYTNSGRLYVEYSTQFNEAVSGKLWVEYLPDFKDSEAWLASYEPSMSVVLNRTFSLKLAYLVKTHNKTATPTEEKNDTTFTTSLVSKF